MSVVARAELEIAHPPAAVFAPLSDFTTWSHWMPGLFRPAWGPKRAFTHGDRFLCLLGGALPTLLQVSQLRDGDTIAWRGGIPGVFVGEHAFYLRDLGNGRTHVLSEEPFVGLLTRLPFVRAAIERNGSRGGADMLEGLARFLG